MLVANKADLVRSRVVSAAEGKQLAQRFFLIIVIIIIIIIINNLIIIIITMSFFKRKFQGIL